MKTISKIAIATTFAALAACGTNNNANNMADINVTDMNAGMTDLNATTDMNATGNMEMNATGNMDMNATGNTEANTAGNSY